MPRCFAVVLVTCLLSACSRPGPALDDLHGKRGGTLRLTSMNDLRTLDTAIGYDIASWRFERLLYDGLLNYGDGADLVPAIAAELPTITGGKRFSFKLRDDVLFHNGRKVVAEDFRYALERILDPKTTSPAAGFFLNIKGAQQFADGTVEHVSGIGCPSAHQLEIELLEPDVSFLNVLAMPFAYPIPKEEVERWTDPETGETSWSEHAVGAGPYRLAEWTRGLRIRVERFEHYYRDDCAWLEAIEQQFGIPEFMGLMMFERGESDVSDIPLPDFERVLADPRLSRQIVKGPAGATYYCSMNCELPPFTDKRVRQAFNYAVDKQRICQILRGTAVPAHGVLPPGMPGYDPELEGYPYSPDQARQLLAQAGYADGLNVELYTRSRPREQLWAESIQQDLSKVGVTATIHAVAFPQWLDLSSKRGGIAFTINAWFQDYPDPSNFLDVLLNGDRITEVNCNNRAFYDNPEVNRLLKQAASMTDLAARLKVYQQVERMVVDDAPWLFVFHPTDYRLVQPWVQNYTLHPVWSSTEERVWLARPTEEKPTP